MESVSRNVSAVRVVLLDVSRPLHRYHCHGGVAHPTIVKLGWISARPLAPRETDFEPWFLFASASFGVGCLAWLSLGLPWPMCWFRHLFGVPCPTCGATRSALALAHGDIGLAFRTNPLMCLLYLGVIIFDLYAVTVLLFRMKRLRLEGIPLQVQRILRVIVVSLTIGNWIYLLCYLR
jgi:hypothetical protein